jgi:hypothetical protein
VGETHSPDVDHEKPSILQPSNRGMLWDDMTRPVSLREGTRLLAASFLSALTSVFLLKVDLKVLFFIHCLAIICPPHLQVHPKPASRENPSIGRQLEAMVEWWFVLCTSLAIVGASTLPLPQMLGGIRGLRAFLRRADCPSPYRSCMDTITCTVNSKS